MADTMLRYGPERPFEDHDYANFRKPQYLRGFSKKIKHDLTRVARLYNGHRVRIFSPHKQGERCPECTNLITGERLVSNCPVCQGTGFKNGWLPLGRFWCFVDFGPRYDMATEYGNMDTQPGGKDAITVVGAPELHDQDLIIFEETRDVYKIYNVEPHIVAMLGDIVTQICQASPISYGQAEYKLIDW